MKQTLTPAEISIIVQGLDPIDWVLVELLAKLPPGKRIIPPLRAQEFSMSACAVHCGDVSQNYPFQRSI